MCRFFAVRSNTPFAFDQPLWDSPTALAKQSTCDRKGESHEHGWGVAALDGSRFTITKSLQPAHSDAQFEQTARATSTTHGIAHIRWASVGQVTLPNTHPFQHGRWVFAHNGTLQRFGTERQAMLECIAPSLREQIGGQTDSEHAFYLWLTFLGKRVAIDSATIGIHDVAESLRATVLLLNEMFPADGEEQTKLNFVLTDGRLLAATRWKHSLSRCSTTASNNEAATTTCIASEPTHDGPWTEVPDRSLVVVDDKKLLAEAI